MNSSARRNERRKTEMKKQLQIILMLTAFVFFCAALVKAQIAGNAPYTLDQSVIASGGGASASGDGAFKIEGTIGQAVAGTTSIGNAFAVKSGFWTSPPLAPTAASVTVSGRVLTLDGSGLRNARIVLIDMRGNIRTTLSGAFGYYRFSAVEAGQTYIFTIVSKRYEFASQVLPVTEEIENLDFTPQLQREK
jgi:hypothetical protein